LKSETASRPASADVKAMIAEATRMDAALHTLQNTDTAQRKAAQQAAQALYADRMRSALEQMEVEHINRGKLGLRVGLLRDHGIQTIWQLSQVGFQQLCAIDGLGEQSARKILDTTRQIIDHTKETIRIRIQIENPKEADEALIKALYIRIHAKPLREQAKALYSAHHKTLQKELAVAKKAANGFTWLFRSAAGKQDILRNVDSLRARLEGDFGHGLDAWEAMENASPDIYWADYAANAPAYYTELESLGLQWEKQDTVGGLPAQLAAEIEAQPLNLDGLKATLRSYQLFGTKYIVHQKKCLLGDEMGLGKTIQAIAAMVALAAEGKSHFMVVCPAGVLINWCREIRKFSDLDVTKVHGNDEAGLLHWRQNGGVAVTTYESVNRFSLPEKFKISMVVTDEAHYVKNPDTKRTKALLSLLNRTDRVLFMSGTPLENRVEEMCFLVSCLQPSVAAELEAVKFLSTAEQFRLQLAPVYLRRTRDNVLKELPELTEKEQWCDLGTQEKQDYKDAVMSDNFMAIRQVSWQVDDLRLSSKANRLLELCEQAKEQHRKVIVFSFFRSTLQKVTSLLGDRCMEPITGDISPSRRQEIVDAFGEAEDGAVLVSQVQAGGTGLNIQSASVIIFCEPQIKPSIEHQAIARAYRMGQVRDVLVYRLLADDTVDERILELLKTKQLQFDSFADESVVGEESLKPSENGWIQKLIEEEKQRLTENG